MLHIPTYSSLATSSDDSEGGQQQQQQSQQQPSVFERADLPDGAYHPGAGSRLEQTLEGIAGSVAHGVR